MNQARSGLGVAVVNGKIYAIGGVTSNGFVPSSPGSAVYAGTTPVAVTGTNEEYDTETDTWKYKTPMPTPRAVFTTVVYQNKIYCIGGKTNDTYTGVTEVYDPATDTWETKTSTPTARGWLGAQVVGNKIHVMGGYPDGTINEVYDPETDSWTTKTPSPSPVGFGFSRSALAVFDNKIYCIGGVSQDQGYNLNQIYDPETDSWGSGASPPTSVDGGAAAATTDALGPKRIYVLGNPANLRQGEEQVFVRIYDPETDNWTSGSDTLTRRYNFGVAVVDDTFYVIGGHKYIWVPGNYTTLAVNEQYTPIRYENSPPSVNVVSPENSTYAVTAVSVVFTVDKQTVWMGYSLDGQDNVTVTEKRINLTDLTDGLHTITVYATDTSGNTGVSETISFTVNKESDLTAMLTTTVIAVAIAVAVIVLIVYTKKERQTK